jgi:hypothetical protein
MAENPESKTLSPAVLADIADAISRAREATHMAKILAAMHCQRTLLVDYLVVADSGLREADDWIKTAQEI